MSKQDKAIQLRLNDVRLSFPQLFHPYAPPPKAGEAPSKKAYQCHLLLSNDHPQLAEAKQALQQVATNQWGEQAVEVLKQLVSQQRVCLRNGNTKTDGDGKALDGYANTYFISARSSTRPLVVGPDKSPLTEEDGKPYSGCYVNAVLRIWPQTGQYGKRINAQLMGVQFARDGDSFGGGRPATPDEFDNLGDFAGADGDIADLIGDDIPF